MRGSPSPSHPRRCVDRPNSPEDVLLSSCMAKAGILPEPTHEETTGRARVLVEPPTKLHKWIRCPPPTPRIPRLMRE